MHKTLSVGVLFVPCRNRWATARTVKLLLRFVVITVTALMNWPQKRMTFGHGNKLQVHSNGLVMILIQSYTNTKFAVFSRFAK